MVGSPPRGVEVGRGKVRLFQPSLPNNRPEGCSSSSTIVSLWHKKKKVKKIGQKQSFLFQSQYNIVLSMQSPKHYRSNTFFIYLQRNIVFHVQSPTFKDQQHGFIVFWFIIFLQFKKRYRSKAIYGAWNCLVHYLSSEVIKVCTGEFNCIKIFHLISSLSRHKIYSSYTICINYFLPMHEIIFLVIRKFTWLHYKIWKYSFIASFKSYSYSTIYEFMYWINLNAFNIYM